MLKSVIERHRIYILKGPIPSVSVCFYKANQMPVSPRTNFHCETTRSAIFGVCRCNNIKKTAKENSFHRNLTWAYKLMRQKGTITFTLTLQ